MRPDSVEILELETALRKIDLSLDPVLCVQVNGDYYTLEKTVEPFSERELRDTFHFVKAKKLVVFHETYM